MFSVWVIHTFVSTAKRPTRDFASRVEHKEVRVERAVALIATRPTRDFASRVEHNEVRAERAFSLADMAVAIVSLDPEDAALDPTCEHALRSTWLARTRHVFYVQANEPPTSWCAKPSARIGSALNKWDESAVIQRRVSCALLHLRERIPDARIFMVLVPFALVVWDRMLPYLDTMFSSGRAHVPLLIAPGDSRLQLSALMHAQARSPGPRRTQEEAVFFTHELALRAVAHLELGVTIANAAAAHALTSGQLQACEATLASNLTRLHLASMDAAQAAKKGSNHSRIAPASPMLSPHLLAYCLASTPGTAGTSSWAAAAGAGHVGCESDEMARVPAGKSRVSFLSAARGEGLAPSAQERARCLTVPAQRAVLFTGLRPEEMLSLHKALSEVTSSASLERPPKPIVLRTASVLASASDGAPPRTCTSSLIPRSFTEAFNSSRQDSLFVVLQFPALNLQSLAFSRAHGNTSSDGAPITRAWLRLNAPQWARPILYLRWVHVSLTLQDTAMQYVVALGKKGESLLGNAAKHHLMGASRDGHATGAIRVGRFRPSAGSRTTLVDLSQPLLSLLEKGSLGESSFFTLYLNVRCDTSARHMFHPASNHLAPSSQAWRRALAPRIVFENLQSQESLVTGKNLKLLCGKMLNREAGAWLL